MMSHDQDDLLPPKFAKASPHIQITSKAEIEMLPHRDDSEFAMFRHYVMRSIVGMTADEKDRWLNGDWEVS